MFLTVTLELLKGFWESFKIFALTLIFALPLGLLLSFGSMSKFKPLSAVIRVFIWIIRGTPLMLQLLIVFYGPGLIFGVKALERFSAVIVAFVINYACYFSEIYRGGIQSVPHGQYEAGQVLGLTRSQIFFKITLMQVIKRIVPPMSNEIITLVKDTSLARIIAVYEIIFMGQNFIKSSGLIWPLFYTGAFYLIFCGILTVIFRAAEKKMSYFE
jgi:polar amino acid transport system permease protein